MHAGERKRSTEENEKEREVGEDEFEYLWSTVQSSSRVEEMDENIRRRVRRCHVA